ncbi:MTHFD1L, partial [Cervus elaphus hippelaphus]
MASVHIGQVIMSIRTKLQNKEQVKFKFPGCWKSHRSGDLLSLMWMKLKTWWWKSSLSQRAVGSNTSLFPAPWINGGPCAPESPDTVPSLTPTGVSLDGKKILVIGAHGSLEATLQCLFQRKGSMTMSSQWKTPQLQGK